LIDQLENDSASTGSGEKEDSEAFKKIVMPKVETKIDGLKRGY